MTCSQECATLEEISSLLSWAQLAEGKASTMEVALEYTLEKLTDFQLHSPSFKKIIKELKEKISQDEAELPEQKKTWA